MPFDLSLMLGDFCKNGNPTLLHVFNPAACLGDCSEQCVAAAGLHRLYSAGRMNNALHGREACSAPGQRDLVVRGPLSRSLVSVSLAGTETSLGSRRDNSSACGLTTTRSRYRSIRSRSPVAVGSCGRNARCLRTPSRTRVSISGAGPARHCQLQPFASASACARHNSGSAPQVCSSALGSCGCRGRRRSGRSE